MGKKVLEKTEIIWCAMGKCQKSYQGKKQKQKTRLKKFRTGVFKNLSENFFKLLSIETFCALKFSESIIWTSIMLISWRIVS